MYNPAETEASKSALLELGIKLKRYHEDMVLVGGWAPYFITNKFFGHCGSIDIDFVLRTNVMKKYDSMKKSVLDLGYRQESEFRFLKNAISPVDDKEYPIHLDFLCEKEGLKDTHFRNVQEDLTAFAFEGCDIAFDFKYIEEFATVLPRNGRAKTNMQVVDLVGSLILKGQAVDGRYKQKDFYDIYSLTFFDGLPEKAAEYFNSKTSSKTLSPNKEKLMKHSLAVLREKFESQEHMGPYQVEIFTNNNINRKNAYARVNSFLNSVKF